MDADEAVADETEGLRSVAAGLRLVLFGLAATVAVQVGFGVATALFGQLGHAKDPAALAEASRRSTLLRSLNADHPDVATVLNGLVVLAAVLSVAGKVFCARAPASLRASGFIVASTFFDVMGLTLYAAGQAGPASEASAELVDASQLPWLLAYFLFLRGLVRLAEGLKSTDLIRRARRQQVGSLALLLGAFLAGALMGRGGDAGILLAGAVGVVGVLILFVLYTRLILDLRRAAEARSADGWD